MATEVERRSFGMTDKGAVFVIKFNNSGDAGQANFTYQVRHGVRTVGDFSSATKAEAIAKALAG